MSPSDESLQRALNYAYFYLNFRARTRHEMVEYLKKKQEKFGWDDDVVDRTISRLEELGYLNDDQFIEMFVESRAKTKKSGKPLLVRDLMKHGVDRQKIDNYFASNVLDDEKLAYEALAPRWSRYADLEKQKRFQKAAGFLSRRGFSYDVVKKTIASLEGE